MDGIFACIYHTFKPNVDECNISHGSYGVGKYPILYMSCYLPTFRYRV